MFKKLFILSFVMVISLIFMGAASTTNAPPTISYTTLGLSVVSSIIVALITAIITIRHFEIKNKKDDIQKAIELSELFAQKILIWTNYITSIYTVINIKEINTHLQQTVDKGEALHFDINEYNGFYKTNYDEIKANIQALDTQVFINARGRLLMAGLCNDYDLGVDKTYLFKEFLSIQSILANTLEYFAMYFNSEIANENAVYQSLHQTFISSVIILYPSICSVNSKSSEKYYTNIIDLFNKWVERRHKIESDLRNIERKHIKAVSGYKKK